MVQADNPSAQPSETKVFLRQGSLLYGSNGTWTADQAMARDFGEASGALIFARASGISGLEIVFWTAQGESWLSISG